MHAYMGGGDITKRLGDHYAQECERMLTAAGFPPSEE